MSSISVLTRLLCHPPFDVVDGRLRGEGDVDGGDGAGAGVFMATSTLLVVLGIVAGVDHRLADGSLIEWVGGSIISGPALLYPGGV